jgi:hypothetical protein
MKTIGKHLPTEGEYPPRFSRGEGAMKTIAGYKNVIDAAKTASNVTINNKQEIKKPAFTKPVRPEPELFSESLRKSKQLPQLISQLENGCGQIACPNTKGCLTSNSDLHKELNLTDRASMVMKALEMQIKDTDKICD